MVDLPVVSRISKTLHATRVSRVHGIDALTKMLAEYLPDDQIEQIKKAHVFSRDAHEGQFRQSGEPYIYHPLAAAQILAEMRQDATTIMAAILHDVIEDTPTARDDIVQQFGDEVATLVDGVSKLSRAQFQSKAEAQAESFRKLLLAMVDDIRVIIVKLADRLHNMRTLDSVDARKRRRIARETLEIYAPIAQRLGINTIRQELEDLGFANLYPNRYRVLKKAVKRVTGNRGDLVREVEERLLKVLREEKIEASVTGRKKNLYSIYRKMQTKHLRFLDVADIYGFRVLVKQVDDCYRALGAVHHVYKPISELFNDYIACPKVNGYQSLHTTLIGPSALKIEVQIRTEDMHRISERGIAAHWMYKLGKDRVRPPHLRAREWVGSLLQDQEGSQPLEFIENVKVDLFPDEVYVFTPKGAIQRLPKGATPVDFAYAVHTELGNRCVAARVNSRLTPLSTPLVNGQTVEIITSKRALPNATWLDFVKTAKARSNIRQYLKHLKTDEAEKIGQRLLNRALREQGIPVRKLDQKRAQVVLDQLDIENMSELYASIGLGERLAPLVARQFMPDSEVGRTSRPEPMAIEGTEGLVVTYGKCCRPIPGDAILGRATVESGIVIHRRACKVGRSSKKDKQDWIDLRWSKRVQGDFSVEIAVHTDSKRGVLARMSTQIADCGCNIEKVQLADKEDAVAVTRFVITVTGRDQLAQVMRRLRQLEETHQVTRI